MVVAAADAGALERAMVALGTNAQLRTRLADQGARDVLAYDHDAWARGFAEALRSIRLSREHC